MNLFQFGIGWCKLLAYNYLRIFSLQATILNQLGVNHERLVYRFQGLDYRLTGVEPARVVNEILG